MTQGSEPVSAVAIDILVESPLWKNVPAAEATVIEAIGAAAAEISTSAGEVSVVLTDDEAIRRLNRDWRKIDKPTNVLSFPAARTPGLEPVLLGDIVIAYETLEREAAAEGKDFLHHLAHLAVHGFLHLMGYDHQTDSDADDMESVEIAILNRLKVPDPYLVRDTD
ncbi:MAG: Metal-dependent hydrolase YbeY, involved in rRNA and/or ribosome maturation and assembly [Pseudolabrys sp.]|jgi:probable rRNA maturation factor|nr:Metal-dependent hydrolase YbeY, involved in rRNA and/or ribosome maturation and assembly [Pseudolabrys sp.]